MALTKVTGQVINDSTGLVVGVTTVGGGLSATDGFFSGIITAVGDASFSGNVSVGGTLTYEDVTNIDAVGLITARNGVVVGSGITLSKDGDIFATGITTISENLKVGTGVTISPDGDGFFTGVITATSYSGIDLSAVTGATGDFSIADKIVHTGDTDTAIRFPSADTITAETGGTERLRITSDGKYQFPGTGGGSGARGLEIDTESIGAADEGVILNARASGTTGQIKLQTNSATAVTVEGNGGNVNVASNLKVAGVCTATSFNGSLAASNLTGALPAIDGSNLTGLGGGVPSGCILIWSGASNAIPTGYVLCDGNNSTPDLRDRFVIGAANNYAVDATGGAATDTVTSTGNYYGATRTGSTGVSGAELVSIATQNYVYNHSVNRFSVSTGYNRLISTLTLNNISVSGTVDTLPPYYALCYIMKT